MKKFIVLCITLIAGCTCLTPLIQEPATVWISPGYEEYKPKVFAIMPFKPPKIRTSVYNNIGEIMADAFETAFLQTDNRVVERSRFQTILEEQQFSKRGYTEEDGIEIGKMVNAHAVLLGSVLDFRPAQYNDRQNPKSPTSCTTISFSVRAIHVESGEIIWKGNITKSTGLSGDILFPCDYNLLKYANKLANDLVKIINNKIRMKAMGNVNR